MKYECIKGLNLHMQPSFQLKQIKLLLIICFQHFPPKEIKQNVACLSSQKQRI